MTGSPNPAMVHLDMSATPTITANLSAAPGGTDAYTISAVFATA